MNFDEKMFFNFLECVVYFLVMEFICSVGIELFG